jgi:hypothetical protein
MRRAYILKNIFDSQKPLLSANFDKESSNIKVNIDVKHSILKHKADCDDIGLAAVAHQKRTVGHGEKQFVG